MKKKKVNKLLECGNLKKLQIEALKRGYDTNTILKYNKKNISIMGDGDFDILDGKLVKYDRDWVDTIYSVEDGWEKIVAIEFSSEEKTTLRKILYNIRKYGQVNMLYKCIGGYTFMDHTLNYEEFELIAGTNFETKLKHVLNQLSKLFKHTTREVVRCNLKGTTLNTLISLILVSSFDIYEMDRLSSLRLNTLLNKYFETVNLKTGRNSTTQSYYILKALKGILINQDE